MLLIENIFLALNGLRANKTRAFLTMLGIIIGIASVIAIMTIGNSVSKAMESEMEGMGANQISLGTSRRSTRDRGGPDGMYFSFGGGSSRDMRKEDYITEDMLDMVKEKFGDRIRGVSCTESIGNAVARDKSRYANISIQGVNGSALEIEKLEMLGGRIFSQQDYDEGRKVCIVSDYYVDSLFFGEIDDALGKVVHVTLSNRNYEYTIIGVYKYVNPIGGFVNDSREDTTTNLYLPLKTAQVQKHNKNGYSSVTILANKAGDASSLCTELEEYMNNKFYRNNDRYEISAFTMESILEEMKEMLSIISLAISFIAGISLLVGGIGVMNIMLVSITERTKEIGTRKALGANNGSIRTQFIVESIVLCLVGGIIGIILGIGIGMIACKFMKYEGAVSVASILFSVGFSASIGIFFGYYPANKAAKMNPIDALRYE